MVRFPVDGVVDLHLREMIYARDDFAAAIDWMSPKNTIDDG
jgi:hypothetical protein